jgi:hypothetical protein
MGFKNNFDFSTISKDKPATYGQVRKVGMRFSAPNFKAVERVADQDGWKRSSQVVAFIYAVHNAEGAKPFTHGNVQKLLTMKQLPKVYRDMFDPDYVKPAKEKQTATAIGATKGTLEEQLAALQALIANTNKDSQPEAPVEEEYVAF